MKALDFYQKKLGANITSSPYRHCSTIVNNANTKPNLLNHHQDHVLISRNATNLSCLHSLLQLCAKKRKPTNGKACHGQVIISGLQTDTLTCNMLSNCYSKCGLYESARKVFDAMPERSLVSWNTVIAGYTQNGEKHKAIGLFLEMHRAGQMFSEFTVSSVLCACAAESDVLECRQLHALAIKAAMDSNVFVGTALLDVYAKSASIRDASTVFERIPERSAVMWSSMVAGYVQNELYKEALFLFAKGQKEGLEHNEFTVSSVLCACAGLAALIEGKQVHAVVCKTGFGSNLFVASSLVDMYAKCGTVKEAYTLFVNIENKNLVLWNVMISGFAKHSYCFEAMILFEKMQQMGMYPDEVTYVSVLSACSHMGLVDQGRSYFDIMTREHKLLPKVIHYSCMVDILCRAGLVHEAYDLIKRMPFEATPPIWGSLLASCRIHGNLELAEIAAKILFEMEPDNAGNLVLLSNTYAACKKWEEVSKARKFLQESEAKKERGKSWTEIKNKVHTFIVGDRIHPRINDIYVKLDYMMEEMKRLGYKA